MNIKVPFDKLKRELNKASIACSKSGQNNQLKSILLKTEVNTLVIRSTNIDIGFESTFDCIVLKEGEFSILGDVLVRLLNTINLKTNSQCEISVEEGLCLVKVDGHSFSLKTTESENFPSIPKVSGVDYDVDKQIFLEGLKNVVFCVAKSDLKPEISGVYVHFKEDELIFVGTDAYRLGEKKVKIEGTNFEEVKIIIPEKNVKDIVRLFEEGESKTLKISVSKNSLSVMEGGIYVVSRLIEGNFPNYTQIIPVEPTSFAIFLKEDLQKSLKIVSFFGDKTNQINIEIEGDKAKLEATASDIGSTKEEIGVVLKGEAFSVKVNSKYLEEFLQNTSDSSIVLKYTAQNKAIIIEGIQDNSFTYLLMPSYR